MKFIVVTQDYSGLGFAFRLQQEGHCAILAVQMPTGLSAAQQKRFHLVGNGLANKQPLSELLARRNEMRDSYWIWDGNHSVQQNEILRAEGFRVFGGGLFPDLMEHDRGFAIRYCAGYGLQAPESRRFTSTAAAVAFLETKRRTAFVFKPDRGMSAETWVPTCTDAEEANLQLREWLRSSGSGPFILQEFKRGIEANTEVWFVNGEPRFAVMGLECKRRHDGEQGEMTGCALDFVFAIPLESTAIRETIGKLFPGYRRMRYTGFGDANVIIDHEGYWLLEKCERFGYNMHSNLFWTLNQDELGTTFARLADGTFRPNFLSAYGASVTVFNEGLLERETVNAAQEMADSIYFWDVYKEGGRWLTAGYDSTAFMVAGTGATPSGAWNTVMEKARRVARPPFGYRMDGADSGYPNSPVERLSALQEMEIL